MCRHDNTLIMISFDITFEEFLVVMSLIMCVLKQVCASVLFTWSSHLKNVAKRFWNHETFMPRNIILLPSLLMYHQNTPFSGDINKNRRLVSNSNKINLINYKKEIILVTFHVLIDSIQNSDWCMSHYFQTMWPLYTNNTITSFFLHHRVLAYWEHTL